MPHHTRFDRATEADDAELRRLLHDNPSDGVMRLRVEKEPSWFAALEVEGNDPDILVLRDLDANRVVGVGGRSEKPCFIDGQVRPLGYLSALRVEAPFQRMNIVGPGYAQMGEMHKGGRARLYLTTVMGGNERARKVLTSGKPGLPTYRPAGEIETHVFTTRRNPWRAGEGTRRAADADVEAICDFLHGEGAHRQFLPRYTPQDLRGEAGLLRGLKPTDLHVVERAGELVGVAGLWDQTPFKQWIVDGYQPRLRRLRPLYNVWARLTGRPQLPPAGQAVAYRFLALPVARDDAAMEALLHAIWADAAGTWVIAVSHKESALNRQLTRAPRLSFPSWLYVVHWDDGAADYAALGAGVPYVEGGAL